MGQCPAMRQVFKLRPGQAMIHTVSHVNFLPSYHYHHRNPSACRVSPTTSRLSRGASTLLANPSCSGQLCVLTAAVWHSTSQLSIATHLCHQPCLKSVRDTHLAHAPTMSRLLPSHHASVANIFVPLNQHLLTPAVHIAARRQPF